MSPTGLEPSTPQFGLLMLSLLAVVVGALGILGAAGTIAISPDGATLSPTPWQVAVVASGMTIGGVASAFALVVGLL